MKGNMFEFLLGFVYVGCTCVLAYVGLSIIVSAVGVG